MGLSLLAHAGMPLKFWDEAFSTTTYLINRLPSWVIDFMSPFEKLFSSKPNYAWLKVFGCSCWPHLKPYTTRKLEFHSKQCVFIRYSPNHKGYKCLDVSTELIYISRDVVFDENVFPFTQLHSNAGVHLRAEILLLPPTLCNTHEYEQVDKLMANGANPGAENGGVQEEHVEEVEMMASNNSNSSSVGAIVDPADAVDPMGKSALDPVPGS
jgi:hypothetical protein